MMKTISVMTAKGAVLDYAVARALGKRPSMFIFQQSGKLSAEHDYSTNWSIGGPLLFKHKIGTTTEHGCRGVSEWMASTRSKEFDSTIITFGDDPLIAGMRCLVESILGEVVEVPDELV
jgi:hypothetical protein